jgi:hypothetical protein
MHASNPAPPAGNALAGPSPPGPARPQYINQPEHDMASSVNFRKDVNLPPGRMSPS